MKYDLYELISAHSSSGSETKATKGSFYFLARMQPNFSKSFDRGASIRGDGLICSTISRHFFCSLVCDDILINTKCSSFYVRRQASILFLVMLDIKASEAANVPSASVPWPLKETGFSAKVQVIYYPIERESVNSSRELYQSCSQFNLFSILLHFFVIC